ncbi:MAG: hypothetical protein AAB897_04010 [Patescibacteria group bacterium]
MTKTISKKVLLISIIFLAALLLIYFYGGFARAQLLSGITDFKVGINVNSGGSVDTMKYTSAASLGGGESLWTTVGNSDNGIDLFRVGFAKVGSAEFSGDFQICYRNRGSGSGYSTTGCTKRASEVPPGIVDWGTWADPSFSNPDNMMIKLITFPWPTDTPHITDFRIWIKAADGDSCVGEGTPRHTEWFSAISTSNSDWASDSEGGTGANTDCQKVGLEVVSSFCEVISICTAGGSGCYLQSNASLVDECTPSDTGTGKDKCDAACSPTEFVECYPPDFSLCAVEPSLGTIVVNSYDSLTIQPVVGSWFFPAGPSDPCVANPANCSGTSHNYSNVAAGTYTVGAPFPEQNAPTGYALSMVFGSCGSFGSTATCLLPGGGGTTFDVYWDPLANMLLSKTSADLTITQGGKVSDSLTVSNNGTANSALEWSTQTSCTVGGSPTSPCPWLSATPASCLVSGGCWINAGGSPSNVITTANASTLAPGTYTGTVTFSGISNHGPHNLTPPQIFTVNFTVTPSLSCTFNGDPLLIAIGEHSTLRWSCNNADNCAIDHGVGSVSPSSGQRNVSPTSTTIYALDCSNQWTSVNRVVEISVTTSTIIEVPP